MYSLFKLSKKYLRYYFQASNGKGHGIHSPFVFDFVKKVLNDKTKYPDYIIVEELRSKLLSDDTTIIINDFGAGSAITSGRQRSVRSIARNAAKPPKYGQLLYRIIRKYQPATVLELGTSLGITTCYLAKAAIAAQVITMEGAASVVTIAAENFQRLQLENIRIVQGNFESQLPRTLENHAQIDFSFLDGNHRKQPTIDYFLQIIQRINQNSIVVLDDIHWSSEMEEAWQIIKKHSAVKCSIDLFFVGILFFREEFKEQQHFSIRF